MRRLSDLLLIIILTVEISAQTSDSVYQKIGHRGFSNLIPTRLEKYNELPERIQGLLLTFIADRFNNYSSSITFENAQIFQVDSLCFSDINLIEKRNVIVEPIPYYDLNYSFKDINLGIQQYWINIGMDKFGQVIYCNFPYLETPRKDINSLNKVKEYSDSIMINMYPEINRTTYKIDLKYNSDNDILFWQFCYLKKAEGNSKDYHCLLINGHYNNLISEEGMIEQHISAGDYGCGDTSTKLEMDE